MRDFFEHFGGANNNDTFSKWNSFWDPAIQIGNSPAVFGAINGNYAALPYFIGFHRAMETILPNLVSERFGFCNVEFDDVFNTDPHYWLGFRLLGGSPDDLNFIFNSSGNLVLRRTSTTLATGTFVFQNNVAYDFEFRIVIDNSSGIVQTWVNDTLDINVSGIDTQAGASSSIRTIVFFTHDNSIFRLDNIVLHTTDNSDGLGNTGRVGSLDCHTQLPTSSSTGPPDNDWLKSSGTSAAAMTDDTPADSDTTYIRSLSNGDQQRVVFDSVDLGSAIEIESVTFDAVARFVTSGNLKIGTEEGGTTTMGATKTLLVAYETYSERFQTNPRTSEEYTELQAVNSDAVVESVLGTEVRVTQIVRGIWFRVDEDAPDPDVFLLTVEKVWRNLEYRYFADPQPPEIIDPRIQILGATDLLPIAELGSYGDMHYVKSWTELDRWEFTIDADTPDGQSLKALGVVPKPAEASHILQVLINNVFDFAGRVESTEIKFADGRTTYVLKGRGVDSILEDKLAIPPAGFATDSYNDIAENVMRAVVDVNLINPQATDVVSLNEAQRAVDNLDQTPNLSAGATVEVEARNQSVFEVVREAALQDGDLGFQILLSAGNLLFDVFEGEDRSAYIVFSINRDNLKNLVIRHDQTNYSTHLIMGGEGDGATRALACAFITLPTGINRKERFQDAREISDDFKLQQRGQAILRTEADYISIEGERLPISYPQYKIDFELGDLITFNSPEYDISVVKRIVEVDVTVAQGRPLDVRLSLGKAKTRQNNIILRNSLQATSRS